MTRGRRHLHFLRCHRGNVDGIVKLVRLTHTEAGSRSTKSRSPSGVDAREKVHRGEQRLNEGRKNIGYDGI